MSRYLKLIWFAEETWTKYHAAVGIKTEKTLCGIIRSTRAILPNEKKNPYIYGENCLKCLAVLGNLVGRYGPNDIVEVKVE
jgi:hypothetical protein